MEWRERFPVDICGFSLFVSFYSALGAAVTTTMAFHLIAVLTLASLASSLSPPCENPILRKEWRTLESAEIRSYLDAVDCIMSQPSITPPFNNSGVKSRYDDLLYTHIQQTFSIHYVGHFLPWHRHFVATYEHMLRTECGYDGAQPYWDWTLDVDSDEAFVASPVFDPELGFGGNGPFVEGNASDPFAVPGRTGGGCVPDGTFWEGRPRASWSCEQCRL